MVIIIRNIYIIGLSDFKNRKAPGGIFSHCMWLEPPDDRSLLANASTEAPSLRITAGDCLSRLATGAWNDVTMDYLYSFLGCPIAFTVS